jgi:hypothetical protein
MYFMAITRGAPFDENNIFTRNSIDGGKLTYEKVNDSLDGGTFAVPNTVVNDCGHLPKVGTATYVPDPYYGPSGLIIGA